MVWNSLVYRYISQYPVICLISECFHSFIYILVSQGYGLDAEKNRFIHNAFIHPLPHNQQYIQTEQFLKVSAPNDTCVYISSTLESQTADDLDLQIWTTKGCGSNCVSCAWPEWEARSFCNLFLWLKLFRFMALGCASPSCCCFISTRQAWLCNQMCKFYFL